MKDSVTVIALFMFLFALAAPFCLCMAAETDKVGLSFEFANGDRYETIITDNEVRDLLHRNFGYMIEWWVDGALVKLGLKCTKEVVDARKGSVAIVAINSVANSMKARWVLYVNGHRSKYHINTQTREGVKTIRLVYEKTE